MGAAAVLFTALGTPSTGCLPRAASEQGENNWEEMQDCNLTIKARLSPPLFYVCHIRPSHARRGRWAAATILCPETLSHEELFRSKHSTFPVLSQMQRGASYARGAAAVLLYQYTLNGVLTPSRFRARREQLGRNAGL